MPDIAMIIPASDEEGSIHAVVGGFLRARTADGASILSELVVVDNNSSDRTAEIAAAAGATVVHERRMGYGYACLRGMDYLRTRSGGAPGVVVFADGDGSNDPSDLSKLVAPILEEGLDFVIGARPRLADRDSLTIPQRFGNQLACFLMRALHGIEFTDLGPFRALRWEALERLGMEDKTYGWTIEMQLKAARHKLSVREIDVRNHARTAGQSKVSGTLRGVVGAGTKIIGTIARYH